MLTKSLWNFGFSTNVGFVFRIVLVLWLGFCLFSVGFLFVQGWVGWVFVFVLGFGWVVVLFISSKTTGFCCLFGLVSFVLLLNIFQLFSFSVVGCLCCVWVLLLGVVFSWFF